MTYKVEYRNSLDNFVDVSKRIHSLDKTKLISDGRIRTTSLTLQADFGDFITTPENSSTVPKIKQFGLFRITYTDPDDNSYTNYFEVTTDLSQLSPDAKYLLPLTLEGRERNLAFIPFSGYFDPPINHFEIFFKILSVYADSKQFPAQPTISFNNADIDLPTFNPNFWDFQYIDNCLDAIIEVVSLADQSVAAGGGGDRFSIIFEDINENVMLIKIKSQGASNDGTVQGLIGDPVYNPIKFSAKIKEPSSGTVVIARGKAGSGGTPRQGDIYRSRKEFYETFTIWGENKLYKKDAYVRFGKSTTNPEIKTGQVYQALRDSIDVRPDTSTLDWKKVSAADYIGDIQYSPLTEDKAALYKNECTFPELDFNPDINNSPKMLDCNIVIDDVETQRDWVYFRSVTDIAADLSDAQKKYLFEGTTFYPGFRMLVDVSNIGTGQGTFDPAKNNFGTGNGNDPLGKSYANNAVIFIPGEDNLDPMNQGGTWFVIKEREDFDQILSRYDGLWEWNIDFPTSSRYPASDISNSSRRRRSAPGTAGQPIKWKSLDNQFLSNDCLHSPKSIENIDGLLAPIKDNSNGNYSDNSAVRIVYEFGESPNDNVSEDAWTLFTKYADQIIRYIPSKLDFLSAFVLDTIIGLYDLFLTPNYSNFGWWITFSAPWPFNNSNGITEEVGEIYGGKNKSQLFDHPFFDVTNQRVAYSGKAGFNEVDSEDLMEITGVKFNFRLDIQVGEKTIPFTGDLPVSYWVIDDNGTIWKSKDKYRLLNDVQPLAFNFESFEPVYRARSPFGISNIVTNITTPELEIRERLFPARIKLQGFMLETSYDDHGRYMPDVIKAIIAPTIIDMLSHDSYTKGVKFIGDIDSFQWVKTPIAIEKSTAVTDKVLFSEIKDYPNITNFEQLKRAALAAVDVDEFQYEQFTVSQNNRADMQLQDTVYYVEENLVAEKDLSLGDVGIWGSTVTYGRGSFSKVSNTAYISLEGNNTGNNPGTSKLWKKLEDDGLNVLHTRKLTVGEMSVSVTNQRNWIREMTLVRRIPKK